MSDSIASSTAPHSRSDLTAAPRIHSTSVAAAAATAATDANGNRTTVVKRKHPSSTATASPPLPSSACLTSSGQYSSSPSTSSPAGTTATLSTASCRPTKQARRNSDQDQDQDTTDGSTLRSRFKSPVIREFVTELANELLNRQTVGGNELAALRCAINAHPLVRQNARKVCSVCKRRHRERRRNGTISGNLTRAAAGLRRTHLMCATCKVPVSNYNGDLTCWLEHIEWAERER